MEVFYESKKNNWTKIPSEINPPTKSKPIPTPATSAESVSSDLDEEVNSHTYQTLIHYLHLHTKFMSYIKRVDDV